MSLVRYLRTDNAQTVRRMDRVQLPADLRPATRTAAGYLVVDAAVAVPGVMEYVDAEGGIVREWIPPDELHDPVSLATLAAVPVTLLHPDVRVTPDNVAQLGVGAAGTSVQILEQTGHIKVELVVQNRDALDAIDAGVDEVSPVYTCTLDETPGTTPDGEPYDRIQRDRRYSEVAVVPEARGGHTVKLRTDHDDRVAVHRQDAAPAAQSFRVVHLDRTPPPPTPPPARSRPMRNFLLLCASALSLPYRGRADGTSITNVRGDMDYTEEQLQTAVLTAIQSLNDQMAAMQEAGAGEGGPEAMQEELTTLRQEKADLEAKVAEMEAGMAQEQEKADRARMDAAAKDLRIDATRWPQDLSAASRALRIVKAKGLLTEDTKLRSDAHPQGVTPESLSIQVETILKLDGGARRGSDPAPRPAGGLHLDGTPPRPREVDPIRPSREDGEAKGSGNAFLDRLNSHHTDRASA